MLDVEPPPGLRRRVMDRLESPRRGIAWAWLAAPVATAAVIVVAVTAPWRDAAPAPAAPPPAVAHTQPPRVLPQAVAPPLGAPMARPTRPDASTVATNDPARRPAMALRPDRLVEATTVAAAEDTNFTTVGALSAPESIVIEEVAAPPPPALGSIDPAPLQIRALEITALPEAPRERREE
jgi:hypothetical protein